MKLARKDLKRLGLPGAAVLALALAAAACNFFANNYLQETKVQSAAASAQRVEVQTRLARATEEEHEIKENLQQYRALLARGIVGEEKRLDWVDSIMAIKNELRLFNIAYDIEPQQSLDASGAARGGNADFVFSRLKLDMPLLHEEDLLNFIGSLSKRGKAHVLARSCKVSRAERGSGATTLVPRLQSTCVFDLITIHHDKRA